MSINFELIDLVRTKSQIPDSGYIGLIDGIKWSELGNQIDELIARLESEASEKRLLRSDLEAAQAENKELWIENQRLIGELDIAETELATALERIAELEKNQRLPGPNFANQQWQYYQPKHEDADSTATETE